MWLCKLRAWFALYNKARKSGQLIRRRSAPRFDLEPLEDRLAPAKIAYLVAGLGGQGSIPGGVFPAALINSLERDGFEVDLANWNSSNYIIAPNPYSASLVDFSELSGNPGSFGATVTSSITTPSKVLGISIPSITIPTAVGFQVDIGSPTQDAFVDAAVKRLTSSTTPNTVVLIGHSLGGSAVLDLAQQLDQQSPVVQVALLATLDPVGYAPSSSQALNAITGAVDSFTSTPSIPYLGIPAIGLQPISFLNGVSSNADDETPGFRGDEFGGGVVNGPVPSNVEYFYNRWQTNGFFPVDFPVDGQITSNAAISDQGVQNTTSPYSVLSNPLNLLGLFTLYVDLDPLTFTNIGLGIEVPSGFNSDFLKSTAQLHYNFPQNATVDANLEAIANDLTNSGLVVTNTDASGVGSLAQAVENADNSPLGGIISFGPGTFSTPQTIDLTSTLDLDNTHSGASITILGPQAGVTIAGRESTTSFFSVVTVAANTDVSLKSLTISDGDSSGNGGGIDSAGTLTITDCTISDNSAIGDGGGIFDSGTLTLTDSTIAGNVAISENGSTADGGGIFDEPPRDKSITLTLTNVTISDNSAGTLGGGIASAFGFHGGPALTATNCTIADNFAFGSGGGIDNTGTLTINNTILAGNTVTTDTSTDNLFTDMNDKVGFFDSNNHNIIGGGITWLAPLNYYGGLTETFALLPGSPAIGAGQPIATVTTDERGFSRPSHPDIGSFQTQGTTSLVVTSTADTAASPGQLSLREAIDLANITPGNNTITFASAPGQTFATLQTIQLTNGLVLDNTTSYVVLPVKGLARRLKPSLTVTVRSSITIDGPATGVTIVGGGSDSDFSVFTVAPDTIAVLDGLTIRNGHSTGNGGGIDNDGTLTLSNVTITGNSADFGGGIENAAGATFTANNTALSSNSASGFGVDRGGGGIDNLGSVTLSDVTITGNSADSGGGIENAAGATLTANNIILSNNSSIGDGGGIDNEGSATLSNVTITGNATGAPDSSGGGIENDGTITLTTAVVSGNSSINGGGIENLGTLDAMNASITGNSAKTNDIVGGSGGSVSNSGGSPGGGGGSGVNDSVIGRNARIIAGGGVYVSNGAMSIASTSVGQPPMIEPLESGEGGTGGGIKNDGNLSLDNSTISDNSAEDEGGGVYNTATLTLAIDTINGNTAQSDAGGIENDGTLTLSESMVSDNTAADVGGGIENNAVLTVLNSTITGNSAEISGGGIENGATLTTGNATITDNSAGDGGGIDNDAGTLTLNNTIVVGNNADPNADLVSTNGYSGNNANLVGTGSSSLAAIGNYGGPTQTIALLPGSSAISSGSAITTLTAAASAGASTLSVANSSAIAITPGDYAIQVNGQQLIVTGASDNILTLQSPLTGAIPIGTSIFLATDQRGFGRPTSDADIGAFQNQGSLGLVVTSAADPVANIPFGSFTGGVLGQLTLREAINLGNVLPGNSTITFAAASGQTFATPQTISLATGLDLNNTLAGASTSIEGPNAGVTIAGGGTGSNFSVITVAANTTASIQDLTISDGVTKGNGGAIENSGTLTLSGVTLTHNSAQDGGAIDNQGNLSLSNSTLADNSATGILQNGDGGGIDNEAAGTMTVSNATIADNSAGTSGKGGGIFDTGTLTLSNTIVAGNTAKTDADIDGAFGGNKNNTIGTGASSLATLANNGGPTATIAFNAGSPALGKGGAVTQIGDDSVGATDTIITVNNGAAIANAAGNFFIQIGGEIMLVTQVSGDTLTVERGLFNTTAASHSPGSDVYLATDQRGVVRSTTAPNIGAFETNSKPLSTSLVASASTLVFGEAVKLTATVTAPNGPPSGYFLFVADNSTILGTATLSAGVATITTTVLSVGTHTITALYVASGVGTGSTTSNAVKVQVGQTSTTVSGFVTPANPQLNQPLTFTATVNPVVPGNGMPTGAVEFEVDGAAVSDVALVAGLASLALPNGLTPGTHVLAATYLGDINFTASAPFTLDMNASTISGELSPATVSQNQPFTFTATVSGQAADDAVPTGFVQFQVDGNAPSEVALVAGQATLDFPNGLPGGDHVITATYQGDGNFDSSSTFMQPLPFNADVAVSASASSSFFAVGQNLTYTVTVVNNGPGTATGVTVTDVLPAAVTLASADFNQGSVAIASGTATWTLGTLADGTSATLTLIITPTAAAGSTLTDTASVTTTTPNPDQSNNTSSVETPLGVVTPFVVTNTNASGPGSLAQAILDSNASPTSLNPGGAPNVIDFDIPANDPGHVYYQNDGIAGFLSQSSITTTTTATDDSTIANIDPDWQHSWYDIQVPATLTITNPVIIDGFSQPGASPNSNGAGLGDNAIPKIDLDGTGNSSGDLEINSPGCTVQGLAINGAGTGIEFDREVSSGSPAVTGNVVQGDFIGTDISGKMALGSGDGINLDASQNTIGGTTPASRNVISGNAGTGISIGVEFGPDTGNVVEGNFIGTDASGTIALGNHAGGISIDEQPGNTIGGSTPAARNIISGNSGEGIDIGSGDFVALNNVIEGNYIGTDVTGTIAVPNTGGGIFLDGTPEITISGNVVSGNGSDGVDLSGGPASSDLVEDNLIGTAEDGVTPLGNQGNGVDVLGGSNNTVSGNVISNNTGAGILTSPFSGTNDAFLANSIYANGNLGINFGGGVVQNHPGGSTSGPNDLENYPVIDTAVSSAAAGTIMQGTFNSTPSTNGFLLQFFASPTADPSGYGQGEVFLGSTIVNTDQNGNASFTVTFSTVIPVGQIVSATATDPNNNTSEFSLAVTVANAVNADLAVSMSASSNSVSVGQNLTYTVTVTNNGPGTALGVTLTNTLPAGVTLVSASFSGGSCEVANGTVTLLLPSLADGASATLTLVVTPTAASTNTITNIASVTADTADPDLANNTASVQTSVNQG